MMNIKTFQVDAFTTELFGGNSAAVCPLGEWLADDVLQKIAMENALAETVFFIEEEGGFAIRWFTPEIEMDLCGHATLAASHVISKHLGYSASSIKFSSNSGTLTVGIDGDLIHMNFPSRKPVHAEAPKIILDSFHIKPIEVLKSRDYVLLYETEEQILSLQPNRNIFDQINLDPGGVIVTAKGNEVDFVSRFFTPQSSILEDPVTGSAHCSLIPYWAEKLSKTEMVAKQLSTREGTLYCKDGGDRVTISGNAITYLEGNITI
jgi:PhzF family phenazine biosynthesis protein